MPRIYAPRRPHVGYREDAEVLAWIDAQVKAGAYTDRSEAVRAATRTLKRSHPADAQAAQPS